MRSVKPTFRFLIPAFAIIAMLIPLQSEAQIVELDQKIFGMDCAPCAKGVEVRMERMNGVIEVELDLNSGEARLQFSDNHTTSLSQLQRSIDGLHCSMCVRNCKRSLENLDKVENAVVKLDEGMAFIQLKEGQTITKEIITEAVEKAGFIVGEFKKFPGD